MTPDYDAPPWPLVPPSPPVSVTALGGEVTGAVLVTYADGTQLVRKRADVVGPGARTGDLVAMTDAEELGAKVLRALGLRAAVMERTGEREVHMEYVEGVDGTTFTNPSSGRVASRLLHGNEGYVLGLADHVMANPDRHGRNWLLTGPGTDEEHLVGIDHGNAFHQDDDGSDSPFAAEFYVRGDFDWRPEQENRFHPDDFAEARQRLEELGPEFERLGHQDWHATMLRRLDALEPHAAGTTRRLPTPGPREWPDRDYDTSDDRWPTTDHDNHEAGTAVQKGLDVTIDPSSRPLDTARGARNGAEAIPVAREVEEVVIDPTQLMPAVEALRNYDVADAAVEFHRQQRAHGVDHDAAVLAAVAAHDPGPWVLAEQAISLYQDGVRSGMEPEEARSQAVIQAADEATPRISAEQAAQVAAAFSEPTDTAATGTAVRGADSEVDAVLGRIDAVLDEPEPSPLAERVAECGQAVDAAEAAVHQAESDDAACIWCNDRASDGDFCSTTCRDEYREAERAESRKDRLAALYDQACADGMPVEASAAWWAEHGVGPLAEQVAECEHAVGAAETAVARAEIPNEDAARAERCARWHAEEQAAEAADDRTVGWERE